MERQITYDKLTIRYQIEGDCDGNHAIIAGIFGENIQPIDAETMTDIKFHCEMDYSEYQIDQYLKFGNLV